MQPNNVLNKDSRDLIISFEKMHEIRPDGRVYAYWDALGYPTIAVGHLLSKVVKENLSKYPSLSIDEAWALFDTDLTPFIGGTNKLITSTISLNEFGAIVSLGFNIGLDNLKSSTLIKKINSGADKSDTANEFLKWDKAGGKVLLGLTRRRAAERELFLKC